MATIGLARSEFVYVCTVTPDAMEKWLAMVHEHASGIERQNELLGRDIQPVFSRSQNAAIERVLLTVMLTCSLGGLTQLLRCSGCGLHDLSAEFGGDDQVGKLFCQSLPGAEQLARRIFCTTRA